MIFDIDKTEYIAIVAGMDCLPSVHVNEVIDHTYIELAQNTAINHFAKDFQLYFRRTKKNTSCFLEITTFKDNFPNGSLILLSFGVCICLS